MIKKGFDLSRSSTSRSSTLSQSPLLDARPSRTGTESTTSTTRVRSLSVVLAGKGTHVGRAESVAALGETFSATKAESLVSFLALGAVGGRSAAVATGRFAVGGGGVVVVVNVNVFEEVVAFADGAGVLASSFCLGGAGGDWLAGSSHVYTYNGYMAGIDWGGV